MTGEHRCPSCRGSIGDGDRVTYGLCAICQRAIRGRKYRR